MKLAMSAPATEARLLDDARETRAMAPIMAIMLFLTVLAAGFGLAALSSAQSLGEQLAGRLTVQIVEADAERRDAQSTAAIAALRSMREVARVAPVDRAALAEMLKPWLGEQGIDPDLPVPALIDVELHGASDDAVARVARAVAAAVPGARIDRYQRWMSPVSRFADLMIGFAAALVLLLAAATAIVVILAARAGLDSHRPTIEVLHMLGSTDVQIARLFQRRIARDALIGGALGTIAALVVILFIGGEIEGLGAELLSGARFGWRDWIALAALPVLFALLATGAARFAVLRSLRRYL